MLQEGSPRELELRELRAAEIQHLPLLGQGQSRRTQCSEGTELAGDRAAARG